MNNRMKYLVVIAALILIALTPQLIRAEGGLTLESLAEEIETLFQGQKELREDIAAIQTQIAPTPNTTATARVEAAATTLASVDATATAEAMPTATPNANTTATARARYRATQVAQANAKATRQARPTATATPAPGLSIKQYEEYVTTSSELVTMAMWGTHASFNNPKFGDSDWEQMLVDVYLATFKVEYENAMEITPPPSMRSAHNMFIRGLKHCNDAAILLEEGIKKLEGSKFEEAGDKIADCTSIVELALGMME